MMVISGEGFLGGLACKESICNVEDLGSIPELGRSPGKGKGYLLSTIVWPQGNTKEGTQPHPFL